MFARAALDTTLGDLRKSVALDGQETVTVAAQEILLDFAAPDPVITIQQRVYPVTDTALLALGSWLDVPSPFLKRLWKDVGHAETQTVLGLLLARTPKAAAAVSVAGGNRIADVTDPGQKKIDLTAIVDIAIKTFGTDEAPVERLVFEPGLFSFDARVPADHPLGVGGPGGTVLDARGAQVDDVTAGGLSFEYDLKRNLTPTIDTYLYRLWCTNGATTVDPGLRVDARGSSVDEVLADLEAVAERAFARVEDQIEHFYNLRHQKADHPERLLRRIARERRIPTRTLVALLDLAPVEFSPEALGGLDATLFDVVNLITNFANADVIRNDGGRRILERSAGSEISDHAVRCGTCNFKMLG